MTYMTSVGHFGLPAEPADITATEVSASHPTCNPDREVLIVDRPCGTGKTKTMIETFDPAKRYLVVAPLLSECKRIARDAVVPFEQPEVGREHDTKKDHLAALLASDRNVVTTHAMFDHLACLAGAGHLDGYEIVIDEVVDIAKTLKFAKPRTWEDIYVGGGYVQVDEITGIVSPTPKWTASLDEIDDALNPDFHDAAKSGRLHHLGDGCQSCPKSS